MTQYVYGKNVVKQLLQEDKKIYEILMAEGMRDTALEKLIKEHKITCKILPRKKMDGMLQEIIRESLQKLMTIRHMNYWNC